MQNENKKSSMITAIIVFALATAILVFYPQHLGAIICLYLVAIGYFFMGW